MNQIVFPVFRASCRYALVLILIFSKVSSPK